MRFEERRVECQTDTQHIVNLSAYHWVMQTLTGMAEMRVLDAACGTGYGSYALTAQARSVVGVDRDFLTLYEASHHYRQPNLGFLTMDCEALAFKDESFDAVVSFETIEHLDDDREFLREVTRVLTPDGYLVLSTPHGKALGAVPENPWHRREYTWDGLQRLLAKHFHSVRFFGRRPSARLSALERELDRVRQFDPLNLRRVLPRRFRHRIGGIISRLQGGIDLEKVTAVDVEYCEGLTATTTLLAVCHRKVR